MKLIYAIFLSSAIFTCTAQTPWQKVFNGPGVSMPYFMGSASNGYVYAFSTDKTGWPILLRSNSRGDSGTWNSVVLPPALAASNDITPGGFSDGPYVNIVMNSTMWRSDDYGTSWKSFPNIPSSLLVGGQFKFLSFAGLVFGHHENEKGLHRSGNFGETWTHVLDEYIRQVIQKGPEIFAFGDNNVYKSSDLGLTWTDLKAPLPNGWWEPMVVLSSDTFLCIHDQQIFVSSDAISWTPKPSVGLPNLSSTQMCWALVKAPSSDTLFALLSGSSDRAIFMSADSGSTWTEFQTGLPTSLSFGDNMFVSDNGFIFFFESFTGRIYRTSKPLALSVQNSEKNEIHAKIYPNPAKDFLHVETKQVGTSLTLFDMLGRAVFNGTAYGVEKSIDISGLPSGNYFLKLKRSDGVSNMFKVSKY